MSDQVINLVLRYRDQGSANAKRAMDAITKGMSDTGRAAQGAAQQALRVHDQLRKVTVLRPNERLPRWFREIGGAAADAASRVSRLTQNMGKFLTAWGQGTAGLAAGKMVLSGPIKDYSNFDTAQRQTVNTMFAGSSIDAKRAALVTMDSQIMRAVKAGRGGVTRAGALEALDTMAGSNEYKSSAEMFDALPAITAGAAGSGASPVLLATLAIRAKQNLGLSDASRVINMAHRSGQLGGFELRNMADLPSQLAQAKELGLTGEAGYAKVLSLNQASMTTSGSASEAANNALNLLTKINSADTRADFKKQGIDLTGELMKGARVGKDALQVTAEQIERVIAADPKYAALQSKLAGATDDERRDILGKQVSLLEGRGISMTYQDRQAYMALLGYRNQLRSGTFDSNVSQTLAAAGVQTNDLAFNAEGLGFRDGLRIEEQANAAHRAMEKMAPALGSLSDTAVKLMQEFPDLSAAVLATTTALTALAAAAGVAAGVGVLTGGRGTAAAAGAGAAAAATAGKLRTARLLAGGLPISAWLGSAGSFAAAAGGVAGAGLLGYGFGTLINDKAISGTATGDAVGEAVARLMAFFGSDEARQAVDVNIRLENGNLVAEVNEKNGREALRK